MRHDLEVPFRPRVLWPWDMVRRFFWGLFSPPEQAPWVLQENQSQGNVDAAHSSCVLSAWSWSKEERVRTGCAAGDLGLSMNRAGRAPVGQTSRPEDREAVACVLQERCCHMPSWRQGRRGRDQQDTSLLCPHVLTKERNTAVPRGSGVSCLQPAGGRVWWPLLLESMDTSSAELRTGGDH